MITITHQPMTTFGGKLILSREFFNPETQDYLALEAHETDKGTFNVAQWVPEGNNGSPFVKDDMTIREIVEAMQTFIPAQKGLIEMAIPEDAWC